MQAVAYATRSALFEERRGIHVNYTNAKKHDVFWETLSPEGSGIAKDDLSIWNKPDLAEDKILTERFKDLELREKKINSARTAYADEFSLPKELTREQNIELVRDFVTTAFISRKLVATYAIHWDEGNPHVHTVFSARPFENGEFGRCKSISRELRGPPGVRMLREIAAQIINKHQELAGLEDRVDHRSYAERGIELIPTMHKGWKAHKLERDGLYSRISLENQQIFQENKERIAAFPSIILKELSATQATFSENDVLRSIQNRLKDDIEILGEHVFHAVMQEAVPVGKNIHDQMRYTTQEYADKEAKVLELLREIGNQQVSLKIDPHQVEAALSRLEKQAEEQTQGPDLKPKIKPNEGQLKAIRTLCGDTQLSVLIGRAGTGKTTTLRPVVKFHKEAGYEVWGMAPSATAAKQLEADTNVKSDTIAHYAYYWKKYDEALDRLQAAMTNRELKAAQKDIEKYSAYIPKSNTLIIVDEAGMVGIGDRKGPMPGGWDAIVNIVSRTGAKLIVTGDDHQFKPIEAGDVFRRLVYELKKTYHQLCELTEIKRQNIDWMREASHRLSELNVATALALYENNGHLEAYSSNEDVYKAIAQQYLHNTVREPDSHGMVITATNEERKAINREIRAILKENGLLPQEDTLQLEKEGYCIGDKIIFTKNDRGWNTSSNFKKGVYVQNNMQAVIQSIRPCVVVDEESGERKKTFEVKAYVPDHEATVKFTLNQFKDFTHSYAVTGHKSQGATLDWTLAKLSRFMDAYALYVDLTRHRDDIMIYYSNEDFKDYNALVSSLNKTNVKDLVVDYSVTDEHKEYWENVQDYKDVGRELVGIKTLAWSLEKDNKEELKSLWQHHHEVEEDRKSLAKVILADWEEHKDFVRQASLTRESIEIAAGLKKRALSRVERQAQVTVEQYASHALEARQLWRDIRRTHPGTRSKSHPDWQKFEEARNQRGILANQIHLNPILHCPFLKEAAENLAKADIGHNTKDQKISYSIATIRTQAEAHQSKILQQELLRDNTKPIQQSLLKVLVDYTEYRDMAGRIWQEVRPKLKAFEGTLLQESFSKALAEYQEVSIKRDKTALEIMTKEQDFVKLAEKVGIKLDFDRLKAQADSGKRHNLLHIYQSHPEQMSKLEAAHKLHEMMKDEADLEKKPTVSFIYQQGLMPKAIAQGALEYQKTKLFESLKEDPARELFLLLDDYDSHCRKARDLYSKCAQEIKSKEGLRPWQSTLYGEYKELCESRNKIALEIFDQRDHKHVLALADKMGVRFKDVELEEIFSRCEQATRTRYITAYLQAETSETKGEAAVAIRQMMAFEKRENNATSKTAQQAFHAGIDFKELQTTAFDYGRACILKGLNSAKEVAVFHALEAYESALRPANSAYKACLDESKEKAVKPWETERFKEYISLVTLTDEKAYQLIKGDDALEVAKIAKEMGVSFQKLDVEAHRHSLRQTLQTFMEGDRTNVPMAAQELLHWLEFDRHSQYKHTFKVLREQDLWPNDLQTSLSEFSLKKRELRHENERESRSVRSSDTVPQAFKQSYKTTTHEQQLSFTEIDQQLKSRMFELATHLIGQPTSKTSTQLRFGNKGSVCVFTNGPKQGLYANHETGTYGGPFKLIEEQAGLTSAREAKEWAMDWLGGKAIVVEQKILEKAPEIKYTTWNPLTSVPKEDENPDIVGNKYLNYMLKGDAQEVARYAYRDEEGYLKGYVFRIEKADGSKITPPLAYCENDKGFKTWRWQAFEKENKTPYGVEKLAQGSAKPILIVEGEKTCDAAQNLLPGYHVLTWSGGSGNVGKTNWQCLAGKDVVIWPDNDKGGLKAADILEKIVTSLNTEHGLQGTVGIVSLPETLPQKWDLADTLPLGWNIDTVRDMIKEAVPLKDKIIILPQEKAVDLSAGLRTYNSQEQEILNYLQDEVRTEKHSWLTDSYANKLLNTANNNPFKALERWQDVSGDQSFKLEPLLSKEHLLAKQAQEQEILAYLHSEVRADKHAWLTESYAQKLLHQAQDNPFTTLEKWKDVSGDDSFEPVIPEVLMTEDQKAIKQNILSYLKEHMEQPSAIRLEQKIFELAEKHPHKGLKEWQLLTQNYDFNPYAHTMNLQELKVNEYLIAKLNEADLRLSNKIKDQIVTHLHTNPLRAYEVWQLYSNDQTFDPKTGIPVVEKQAQELINSIKSPISNKMLKSWQDQLTNQPESVIKQCQEFIRIHNEQELFNKSVIRFIQLSETSEQLSWNDPKLRKIDTELKQILDRYLKDENFKQKIEGSKSQAAFERLTQEIKQRDQELSPDMEM